MDFDSLPNDAAPVAATAPATATPQQAGPSFDDLQDDGDKYSGVGQQVKAGLEGVAQGVLGPIATGAERMLGNVPRADILGRAQANPITHGVGEGIGLVGSSLTGVGEGAIMSDVGHLAQQATGLGDVSTGARLSYKIGSEAVKQAAEMAVLQGSDEASKMILKDPETSTESAIANTGLAAVLGGAGGAAFGVVSPLWSATGGAALDKLLGGLSGHLNGGQVELPENIASAFKDLGQEPSPIMKAALSGDARAVSAFQDLYRAEHPDIMNEIQSLPTALQQSVTDSLGVSLDDASHFSNAQSGEAIDSAFKDQISKDADPVLERLDAEQAENNKISMPDDKRLSMSDQVREASLGENVGVNSPAFKEYEQAANQILDKESVGGMNKLSQDLGKTAYHLSTDPVRKDALLQIKGIIDDGIQSHITNTAADAVGSEGVKMGAEKLAEMQANKADYRALAQKYNGILDYLGMKKFSGTGNMRARLADLTPETLLKKFASKGDLQGRQMLEREFPEIAQMVKEHEAKSFLAPSVHDVAGDATLDIKSLSKRLDNLKKGSPEHANWVMSPEAQSKLASAKTINDALSQLKGVKNSGTPAGMAKVFRHMGSSALSAVSLLAGHNPIGGYILGEAAQHLGKSAPEAVKLGMLKYMGSAQPVKAEGFKAMVDLMHNTVKGESMLAKGAQAVFKAGAQVGAERPDQVDRDKLDKQVTKLEENPGQMTQMADGSHLGHYMPDHQAALTQAQVRATQYLQSIKPRPQQLSPLDKPIDPTPQQTARYNRALDIAASPGIVMQHVKDGTLQMSDIQDLHSMFPALAKNMAGKLSTEATHAQEQGQLVPYKTKIALSMFLGQPMDSTMTPSSIMAAQPQSAQPPAPSPQGSKMKGGAKTATSMNKNAESYRTGPQAGEASNSSRD